MLSEIGRLAIIGCGTMGEAIAVGLLGSGAVRPEQVIVTARRTAQLERLAARLAVATTLDNLQAMRDADVVLVALKPQQVAPALDNPAARAALAGKLVISIAAGVRVARLAEWLPDAHVVRAMPNTPCLIGCGMTVIARGPSVADEHAAIARAIFDGVGHSIELEDKLMDAVTSLNGSGPAFVFVILEAFTDGGVRMGLRRDHAAQIAAHVMQGAARMMLETGQHPAALKDQVTTPAGCKIAGLLTMEDGRIRSVLARAVEEAAKVAGTLG